MTPAAHAKELMDLVATPSGLVTGTFLAFATRAIRENAAHVDPPRMWFALLASLAASTVAGSLVVLLAPLAARSIFVYRGGVESVLVVYWTIFLSAIGTFAYAVLVTARAARELRRPSK